MRQAYRRDQPVVVIDAKTRKRHLIWAELDANADAPEDVVLHIRPGRNFLEGRRYIVALRNLKDADGKTIPAQPAFRIYRDRDRHGRAADRAPARALRVDLQDAPPARRSRAGTSTSRGTSRSRASGTSRSGCSRSATTRSRQLGDENLGDLKVEGDSPGFVVTDDRGLRRVGEPVPPPPRRGPRDRPVLPEHAGLPAGRELQLRRGQHPGAAARATPRRRTSSATSRARRPSGPAAPVAVRARAARRRDRGGLVEAPEDRQPVRVHVLRDGLERHVAGGHPQRGHDPERPLADEHAGRPRPAGDAQLPLRRAGDDPPGGLLERPGVPGRRQAGDRHAPAVLRRRVAGRDHGRRPGAVRA